MIWLIVPFCWRSPASAVREQPSRRKVQAWQVQAVCGRRDFTPAANGGPPRRRYASNKWTCTRSKRET